MRFKFRPVPAYVVAFNRASRRPRKNDERARQVGGMAHLSAFRPYRRRSSSFVAGCTLIQAAAILLGADYNSRHRAVITWRGALRLMAAFRGYIAWCCARWICGESLFTEPLCLLRQRVLAGTPLCPGAFGLERLPLRRGCARDCASGAADGSSISMGSRLSSLCRSIYRNRSRIDIRLDMAGGRSAAREVNASLKIVSPCFQ